MTLAMIYFVVSGSLGAGIIIGLIYCAVRYRKLPAFPIVNCGSNCVPPMLGEIPAKNSNSKED